MLDERQIRAIELLVSGEHTITRISELVGVSRQTIYNWLDDDEFKKNLDERMQQIKTSAAKQFDAKLDKAIDLYWELATDPKTDKRTKQIALSYWIDRSLGKPVSRTEMTDNTTKDNKVSDEDILSAIDEARAEDSNDNVIDIDNIKKAK